MEQIISSDECNSDILPELLDAISVGYPEGQKDRLDQFTRSDLGYQSLHWVQWRIIFNLTKLKDKTSAYFWHNPELQHDVSESQSTSFLSCLPTCYQCGLSPAPSTAWVLSLSLPAAISSFSDFLPAATACSALCPSCWAAAPAGRALTYLLWVAMPLEGMLGYVCLLIPCGSSSKALAEAFTWYFSHSFLITEQTNKQKQQ